MKGKDLWVAIAVILVIIIVVAVMVSRGDANGTTLFGSRLDALEKELMEINENIERHTYLIDLGIETGMDTSVFRRSLEELRERRMILKEQIENL